MNSVPVPIPGETYFFRDPPAFEALERELLPPLLAARREADRRLRVWSAGCCTGEECYSLAITLCRLLPDIADWDIRIVGTDIHPGFLARAEQGVYGEWAFRGVPAALREGYFDMLDAERHAAKPALRRLVAFRCSNLAEDEAPGAGFDLVLCRHLLMYFDPAQAERAIGRLHDALAPGGWLLVGPLEAIANPFNGFRRVRFGETVFHRKPAPQPPAAAPPATVAAPKEAARPDPQQATQRAIRLCEAAIAGDPCDAALHYRHAVLLETAGRTEDARHALRRALFLEGDFVLAQVALARLNEGEGQDALAHRQLAHALRLLDALADDTPVPHSGGMSAARLRAIVRARLQELGRMSRRAAPKANSGVRSTEDAQ